MGLITKGIVGCALSHKKAWKKFIDSKEDTALFFEDDLMMTKDIFRQPPGQEVTKYSEYTQYYTDLLNEIDMLKDYKVNFSNICTIERHMLIFIIFWSVDVNIFRASRFFTSK